MTARVLKFSRDWDGRFEASEFESSAHLNALNDARQIIAAKREANNWMSHLLVALLTVIGEDQLKRLEMAIETCPPEEDTRQALALVRLANSDKAQRRRVLAAMDALNK